MVNLVLQAVGIMTVLACQACNTDTVILTGAMTTMPQAVENFQNFQRLFGYQYVFRKTPPLPPHRCGTVQPAGHARTTTPDQLF